MERQSFKEAEYPSQALLSSTSLNFADSVPPTLPSAILPLTSMASFMSKAAVTQPKSITASNGDFDKGFDEELKTFKADNSDASDNDSCEQTPTAGDIDFPENSTLSTVSPIVRQVYQFLRSLAEAHANSHLAVLSSFSSEMSGESMHKPSSYPLHLISLIEKSKVSNVPVCLSPLKCILLRHPLHKDSCAHHVHTLAGSFVQFGFDKSIADAYGDPLVAIRYNSRTDMCRKDCVGQPPITHVLVPEMDELPVYYVISGAARSEALEYAMRVRPFDANIQSILRPTAITEGAMSTDGLPFYVLNGASLTADECTDLSLGLDHAFRERLNISTDVHPFQTDISLSRMDTGHCYKMQTAPPFPAGWHTHREKHMEAGLPHKFSTAPATSMVDISTAVADKTIRLGQKKAYSEEEGLLQQHTILLDEKHGLRDAEMGLQFRRGYVLDREASNTYIRPTVAPSEPPVVSNNLAGSFVPAIERSLKGWLPAEDLYADVENRVSASVVLEKPASSISFGISVESITQSVRRECLIEKLDTLIRISRQLTRQLQMDASVRQLALAFSDNKCISSHPQRRLVLGIARNDKKKPSASAFDAPAPSVNEKATKSIHKKHVTGKMESESAHVINTKFKWLVWLADVMCPNFRSFKNFDEFQHRCVIPGLLYNNFAAQIRHMFREYIRYDAAAAVGPEAIGIAMAWLISICTARLKEVYKKDGLTQLLKTGESVVEDATSCNAKEASYSETPLIISKIKRQMENWSVGPKISFFMDKNEHSAKRIHSVERQGAEDYEAAILDYSWDSRLDGIFHFIGSSIVALFFSTFVHQDEACITEEVWRTHFRRNAVTYLAKVGELACKCRVSEVNLIQCCNNIRLRILEAASLYLRFTLSGCGANGGLQYREWKPFPSPVMIDTLCTESERKIPAAFCFQKDVCQDTAAVHNTTISLEASNLVKGTTVFRTWLEVDSYVYSVLLRDVVLHPHYRPTDPLVNSIKLDPLLEKWLLNRKPEVLAVVVKLLEEARRSHSGIAKPRVQRGDSILNRGYEVKLLDASVLPMAHEALRCFVDGVLPVAYRVLRRLAPFLTLRSNTPKLSDPSNSETFKGAESHNAALSSSKEATRSGKFTDSADMDYSVASNSDLSILEMSKASLACPSLGDGPSKVSLPKSEATEKGKACIVLPACLPILTAIRVCVNLLPPQFDTLAPQSMDWMEARGLLASWIYGQSVNGILAALQTMDEVKNARIIFSMAQNAELEFKPVDMEIVFQMLQRDIRQLLHMFQEACYTKQNASAAAVFWQKGEGVQFMLPKVFKVLHNLTKGAEPISIAQKDSSKESIGVAPSTVALHGQTTQVVASSAGIVSHSVKRGKTEAGVSQKPPSSGHRSETLGVDAKDAVVERVSHIRKASGMVSSRMVSTLNKDASNRWNDFEFGPLSKKYTVEEAVGRAIGPSSGQLEAMQRAEAHYSNRFFEWVQSLPVTDRLRLQVDIPYFSLVNGTGVNATDLLNWLPPKIVDDGNTLQNYPNDRDEYNSPPNPLSEFDWKVIKAVLKLLRDRGVDTLVSTSADVGFVLKDVFAEKELERVSYGLPMEGSSKAEEAFQRKRTAEVQNERTDTSFYNGTVDADATSDHLWMLSALRRFLEGSFRDYNLEDSVRFGSHKYDLSDYLLPTAPSSCTQRPFTGRSDQLEGLTDSGQATGLDSEMEMTSLKRCSSTKRKREESEKETSDQNTKRSTYGHVAVTPYAACTSLRQALRNFYTEKQNQRELEREWLAAYDDPSIVDHIRDLEFEACNADPICFYSTC